jgi:hypothetical protein
MADGEVSGIGLAAIAAGSLFMWAGIKGTSITGTLQNLITGKAPPTNQTNPITTPAGSNPAASGSGVASGLADTMVAHLGHTYVFGGSPGPDGQGPWDCSSAMNWCATRNGLRIPGFGPGAWNMVGHGPATFAWLAWAPGRLHRVSRSQVQRNDVVLWQTHIGVAVDGTNYASAAGAGVRGRGHEDTIVQPINGGGPTGELATFWRYTQPTVPAGKGSFSHAGLMTLWEQAGGSAATANNAACHAIQESSGDPAAESANPDGGTNVGLWQLDTKGVGAGHSIAALKDPMTNAKITVRATGNGRNWSQWATPGC